MKKEINFLPALNFSVDRFDFETGVFCSKSSNTSGVDRISILLFFGGSGSHPIVQSKPKPDPVLSI